MVTSTQTGGHGYDEHNYVKARVNRVVQVAKARWLDSIVTNH